MIVGVLLGAESLSNLVLVFKFFTKRSENNWEEYVSRDVNVFELLRKLHLV